MEKMAKNEHQTFLPVCEFQFLGSFMNFMEFCFIFCVFEALKQ